MKNLKIRWQRLVDEKGKTCQRCGLTEQELKKAVKSLKKSLAPLRIKVALEKQALDASTCAKDVSQSNRIWLNDRALEEWLSAEVGKSLCGFCCEELGDNVECRTLDVGDQTHETIPAELIIKAGLLAASQMINTKTPDSCCSRPKRYK
ncbi:MAG: DUF2703 domain-containing protein [Candidatus Omnitrophota bacterium]|nr:MAG: DUF2703 domain-containing protein [Candidatus Omnitrophota bacterium]